MRSAIIIYNIYDFCFASNDAWWGKGEGCLDFTVKRSFSSENRIIKSFRPANELELLDAPLDTAHSLGGIF